MSVNQVASCGRGQIRRDRATASLHLCCYARAVRQALRIVGIAAARLASPGLSSNSGSRTINSARSAAPAACERARPA